MFYRIEYSETASATFDALSLKEQFKLSDLLGGLAKAPQGEPGWSRLPLTSKFEADITIKNEEQILLVTALHVTPEEQ
jgi:hypothetical protein